jgi:hypothetical protein
MTDEAEEMKKALKAFKKRLKLYRQDDESNIGRAKLTSGRPSGIVGIRLPDGFKPEVWAKLESQGRLKRVPGTQTYELGEPPGST